MNRRESREQAFVFIFEKSFNTDMSLEELIENAELADAQTAAFSVSTQKPVQPGTLTKFFRRDCTRG